MRNLIRISLGLGLLSSMGVADAANLYGNNAGGAGIFIMDLGTLAVTKKITNITITNGRGVVVVGNTLYYTEADSGNVFSYNLTTSTNNGPLFAVAGASGLSTAAFDGTNLWLGDYSGTNKAYVYSLTGTLVKTVPMSNCTGYCDGLEYFLQGGTTPRLISNRCDECGPHYDVYDTNGTLVTADFLTGGPNTGDTGIAYDGTNFDVSYLGGGLIYKFNGATGAFVSSTAVTGAGSGLEIEDLSVDYTTTIITGPPPTTPAPNTFLLIGTGLALLTLWSLRSQIRDQFAR